MPTPTAPKCRDPSRLTAGVTRDAAQPGMRHNICERSLKKAILHRKNALFYRTLNGARVGDTFMSLIHTAELSEANPFEYLVSLLRHHQAVAEDPADWMPWNYQQALSRISAATPA